VTRLLERLYGRLGARYFLLFGGFEAVSALLVCAGTVGLFSLYVPLSGDELGEMILFSQACVAVALVYVVVRAKRAAGAVIDWVAAGGPEDGALAAWRCAVGLPRELVARNDWKPFAIVALPIAVFATLRLELPAYSAAIIFAGSIVAVAYSAVLHFFGSELFMRPVIEHMARSLPPSFSGARIGVPLRWKLLGALPIVNVVTGVVVSGLSTDGRASLDELGVDVLVAVLVAFTLSFELTLLITKSVLGPVDELLKATERVKRGDYSRRLPLTSADEMGALAGSFNEMMEGLAEREALREAFGAYVDPEVAKRVVAEGELLEGQEREVTVMFVDVRDFTPYAESRTPQETVAFLNDFFELVVPLVTEHGGHANKFLGDGVLCVFGAPERLEDHADRALAAAGKIVEAVGRRFRDEVRVGVGLNSGTVVVGSVGGGGRLEFSVTGDPVNVAARVEAQTRDTEDAILLTAATRALLPDPQRKRLEARGKVPLRGKSEPVPVYAVEARVDKRTIPQTGHIKVRA
jgi:class 3 adenylate cyclase